MHTEDDVTVVLPEADGLYELLRHRCRVVIVPLIGFKKTRWPPTLLRYAINVLRTSRLLGKVVAGQKIQLLVANSFKAGLYGVVLKHMTGRPLLCFIRDNLSPSPLVRTSLARMDRLACVSHYILEQVPAPNGKKKVIYPPIATPAGGQDQPDADFRKRLGIHPHTTLFATIGQFRPWKNQAAFIEVARRIVSETRAVHFLVCGPCWSEEDEAYRQSLLLHVEALGLQSFFSFLPFHNDTTPLYQSMDVLVHCALVEPFGRVTAEAMAHARPVVAFDAAGTREIIADGATGYLVAPGDLDEMAARCLLLSRDPSLRVALGRQGRQRVTERFSVAGHVAGFEGLVSDLTASVSPPFNTDMK